MSRENRPGAATNLELAKAFWEASDRGDMDHVIARVRGHGRARGGVPIDMRAWQVAEFRAGKIVRVETFPSEEQALEAVGLRE